MRSMTGRSNRTWVAAAAASAILALLTSDSSIPSDRRGGAVVIAQSIRPIEEAGATKSEPNSDREELAFEAEVTRAARERLAIESARGAENIAHVEREASHLDETLDAIEKESQAAQEQAEGLWKSVEIADRIDKAGGFQPKAFSPDLLRTAKSRCGAVNPSGLASKLAALKGAIHDDHGVMESRIRPLLQFMEGLMQLDGALESSVTTLAKDPAELPEPSARALYEVLIAFSEYSEDFESLRADIEVLVQVAPSAPFISEQNRTSLKDDLDEIQRAFSDGRIALAIEAQNDLLAQVVGRAEGTVAEQGLSLAQDRLARRIRTLSEADAEPSYRLFSSVERKELADALSQGTRSRSLEAVVVEARDRAIETTCREMDEDPFDEAFCALEAVSVLRDCLRSEIEPSTESCHKLLSDALRSVARAEFIASKLDDDEFVNSARLSEPPKDSGALDNLSRFRKESEHPSSLETIEELTGISTDVISLHRWYGSFAAEVTYSYWERERALIQDALLLIEDSRNVKIQMQRLEADQGRHRLELGALQAAALRLDNTKRQLAATATEPTDKAESARSLFPDISLRNATEASKAELWRWSTATTRFNSVPLSKCGETEGLTESIQTLSDELTKIDRSPSDPILLTASDRAQLIQTLAAISVHFGAFADPKCVRLGYGQHRMQITVAIDNFIAQVAEMQARLSGVSSSAANRATVDRNSLEGHEILSHLAALRETASDSIEARSFLEGRERSVSWFDPFLALQITNEVTVFATGGIVPLAYGFAGVVSNPIGVTVDQGGAPRVEEFTIEKIPGLFSKGVGAANAGMLTYGGAKELESALENEPSRFVLDSEVFGQPITAKLISNGIPKPVDGVIYILPHHRQFLLEITSKQVEPEAVVGNKHWSEDSGNRTGVFTTFGGRRYYWNGSRPMATRMRHLERSGLAGLETAQIATGLATQSATGLPDNILHLLDHLPGYELVRVGDSPVDRILDGVYLIGLVVTGKEIADSIAFKATARHGGYLDSHMPDGAWITIDGSGNRSCVLLQPDGDLLIQRDEPDGVYYDSSDGTVRGRIKKHGRGWKFLTFVGIRSKYQAYIESETERKAGAALLAKDAGAFLPRRPGSAAMFYEGENGLSVKVGLNTDSYELGDPMELTVDGKLTDARPFFGRQAKELRGLILTSPGQTSHHPGSVTEPVLFYVGSESQFVQNWNAVVNEGTSFALDPIPGEIQRERLKNEISIASQSDGTARWSIDLNGTARLVSVDGKILFSISTANGFTTVLDRRVPARPVSYLLEGKGDTARMNLGRLSISGVAKFATLSSAAGQWMRISGRPFAPPPATRTFVIGESKEVRLAWDAEARTWRANVESPGSMFPQPGTYQYEPGTIGIQKEIEGMSDPFELLHPMPELTPDFEKELSSQSDAKETEHLPDGSSESRYYFHKVGPDTRGSLIATFIVRIDSSGERKYFVADSSAPGIRFRDEANASGVPAFWSPIPILPDHQGSMGWVTARPPPTIEEHIRKCWKDQPFQIDASYARDEGSGDLFLKIVAGVPGQAPHLYLFTSAITEQEFNRRRKSKLSDRNAYASLPPGIPDEVIVNSPDFMLDIGSFIRTDGGLWAVREPSKRGLEEAHARMLHGQATILNRSITSDLIKPAFSKRGRSITCTGKAPGHELTYGGMIFMSCYASNSTAILRAVADGEFSDPQSHTSTHLFAGQLVVVEVGSDGAGIDSSRARQKSGVPYLQLVFKSATDLIKDFPSLGPIHQTIDRLPSFLGGVAPDRDGPGTEVRQIGTQGFFEDAENGNVWYVHSTQVQRTKYLEFNRGSKPGWSVSVSGWTTIDEDYQKWTADHGRPNQLDCDYDHLYSFTAVTGSEITGHLVAPRKSDPFTPTLLVVEHGGQIRDPYLGIIGVAKGDTLILRVPAALQLATIKASKDASLVSLSADGNVKAQSGLSFGIPEFGGLSRVSDLSAEEKRSLAFPYPDDTLVQRNGHGGVPRQVMLQPDLIRWLRDRYLGWGYVVMEPGTHTVIVNGAPRDLAGLVGVGSGRDQLSVDWVRAHMSSRCGCGCSFDLKWDNKTIGHVVYGVDAARDAGQKQVDAARKLLDEASAGPPYADADALFLRVKTGNHESQCDTRLEHLVTHLKITEHHSGTELVRTHFAPDDVTPTRRVIYDLSPDGTQTPLYSEDGTKDDNVVERYHVKYSSSTAQVAAYTPDGTTLLGIQIKDREGHLLRQWNASSQLLEVNLYQPMVIHGRFINGNGTHDSITRVVTYRATPEVLGITSPTAAYANPLASPKPGNNQHRPAIPSGPLPDLPENRSKDLLVGTTVYSGGDAVARPLFHIDRNGSIDEVYESLSLKPPSSQATFRVHAEHPGDDDPEWGQNRWKVDSYGELLRTAELASTFTEIQHRDALGRVTEEVRDNYAEKWVTAHAYSGVTNQLVHSRVTYMRMAPPGARPVPVADIYYPGRRTFDEALEEGIDEASFEAALANAGTHTQGEQNTLTHDQGQIGRYRSFLESGQMSRRKGFDQLINHTSRLSEIDQLRKNEQANEASVGESSWRWLGLQENSVLESSIFIPRGGGISVLYRRPLDPSGRILMTDLGFSRTIAIEWEGGETTRSISLTPENDVLGTYQTARENDDPLRPIQRKRLRDVLASWFSMPYFNYAAAHLGNSETPRGYGRTWSLLWEFLPNGNKQRANDAILSEFSRIGIKPDAIMTVIRFVPRKIFHEDGNLVFSQEPDLEAAQVYYRLPDDPLGNYLIQTNSVDRNGNSNRTGRPDIGSINLWSLRGLDQEEFAPTQGSPGMARPVPNQPLAASSCQAPGEALIPPIDLSPGTITVQRSAPEAGGIEVFRGLMLFQGREKSDQAACDPDSPGLTSLSPLRPQTIAPDNAGPAEIQDRLDAARETLQQCCGAQLKQDAIRILLSDLSLSVSGYWYTYQARGDYLEKEFHERDSGRVFARVYTPMVTVPGRPLVHKGKRWIFYDLRVPYERPLFATDDDGSLLQVWLRTSLYRDGGETQTLRIKDPILNVWTTAVFDTDADGLAHVPEPQASVFWWVLGSVLSLGVLLCLLLMWASRRGARRWAIFAGKVRPKASVFSAGEVYDETSAKLAVSRIARRVLAVHPQTGTRSELQQDPHLQLFTTEGVAETGFLYYLYPIYACIIQWRMTEILRTPGARPDASQGPPGIKHELEIDPWLMGLDAFSVGIGTYLASELSYGHGNEVRFYSDDKRRLPCDPDIWEKLTSFLQLFFILLRDASGVGRIESVLEEFGVVPLVPVQDEIHPYNFEGCTRYRQFLRDAGWDQPAHRPYISRLRRCFGWHTKAIHVFSGQEFADLLPIFSLALLSIGLVFENGLSQLWSGLAQARTLAAIAGAVLLTVVGAFLEWNRLSTAGSIRRSSPGWLAWLRVRPGALRPLKGAMSLLALLTAYLVITIPNPSTGAPTQLEPNLGLWFLKVLFICILFAETWGYGAMGHSLVGLSVYHHLRPTIGSARRRVTWIFLAQVCLFLITSVIIGRLTYSWWYGHYHLGSIEHVPRAFWSLVGAFVYLNLTLYLVYTGLWFLLTGIISFVKTIASWWRAPGPAPAVEQNEKRNGVSEKKERQYKNRSLVINYVGPELASPIFREYRRPEHAADPVQLAITRLVDDHAEILMRLLKEKAEAVGRHLESVRQQAAAEGVALSPNPNPGDRWENLQAFVDSDVRKWLTCLYRDELANDMTFLHRCQLEDAELPPALHIATANWSELLLALELTRQTTLIAGFGGKPIDTGIHVMDVGEIVGTGRHAGRVVFVQTYNKYENHFLPHSSPLEKNALAHNPLREEGQHEKIGRLFSYLAEGRRKTFEDRHAVVWNWTNGQSKSTAMNGLLTLAGQIETCDTLHILDRNANCFQLDKLMNDYSRISNQTGGADGSHLVIMVPLRNTSNSHEPIGRQSEAIEGGQGSTFLAVPDKIGTGWENLMSVPFWDVICAMSHNDYPLTPLSGEAYRRLSAGAQAPADFEYFGLIGFGPNAIGQSEDLWGVLHQTHNLIGVGKTPRFDVMEAPATKIRESASSFGVLEAATRWAGGLIDTLSSPVNQLISTFGPEDIFERKARRSIERFYLSTPVGVLTIAFLFPAIYFDMNPFAGLLLVFWVAAFLFNQVLSLHGLVASIRARGPLRIRIPRRILAWMRRHGLQRNRQLRWFLARMRGLGMLEIWRFRVVLLCAGALSFAMGVSAFSYELHVTSGHGGTRWLFPFTFGAAVWLGAFLAILSPSGFSYWFRTRLWDVILFAPRYFMEAGAVVLHLAGADHSFASSKSSSERHMGTLRTLLAKLGISREVHERFAHKLFALLPMGLSLFITLEATLFTAANLDFNNLILLWLVLAFVGGGAVGFFTEDVRPGQRSRDRLFTVLGSALGLAFIWALHLLLADRIAGGAVMNRDDAVVDEFVKTVGIGFGVLLGIHGLIRGAILFKALCWYRYFRRSQLPVPDAVETRLNEGPKWDRRRWLSNIERGAVRIIAILGWFAFVQIPNTLRVTLLPNQELETNTDKILIWIILVAFTFLAAVLIAGKCTSMSMERAQWRRFTAQVSGARDTTRGRALLAEFLVKMGLGHWEDAKRTMDLLVKVKP